MGRPYVGRGKFCSNACRHEGRRKYADGLTQQERWRRKQRDIARPIVQALRDKTVCKLCGKQPIEYHRKEHETQPRSRISYMVISGRSVADILAEIARCEPLCHRCHQIVDGRMKVTVNKNESCDASISCRANQSELAESGNKSGSYCRYSGGLGEKIDD